MSAQTVYAYLYDYTDNDGVKTKESSEEYVYFVSFYGDSEIGKSAVRKKDAYDKWYEYEKKAIDYIAETKAKSEKAPEQGPSFGTVCYYFLKRYADFSTATKTTYRPWGAERTLNPRNLNYRIWETEHWLDDSYYCYSISNDKSSLIIWSSSPKRIYYKRITRSDLLPNIDFLNE